MKTYFQLMQELLEATATKRKKPFDSDAFDAAQKAKYGSSMAKAAADALAAAQKRKAAQPTRKTIPWVTSPKMLPAWWHPTKEPFVFSINGNGYHVTQLVKYPEKFGIYSSDLQIAAEEEAEERSQYYSSGKKISAKQLLDDIRKEDIDNAWSISMLAYSNGWLRVYGGKFHTGELGGTLEGTDRNSMKAAVREIMQSAEMANVRDFRIDLVEVKDRYGPMNTKKLDTDAKRSAYLKG